MGIPPKSKSKSIRINQSEYDGLLMLKHGNETFSDVIKELLIEYVVDPGQDE